MSAGQVAQAGGRWEETLQMAEAAGTAWPGVRGARNLAEQARDELARDRARRRRFVAWRAVPAGLFLLFLLAASAWGIRTGDGPAGFLGPPASPPSVGPLQPLSATADPRQTDPPLASETTTRTPSAATAPTVTTTPLPLTNPTLPAVGPVPTNTPPPPATTPLPPPTSTAAPPTRTPVPVAPPGATPTRT